MRVYSMIALESLHDSRLDITTHTETLSSTLIQIWTSSKLMRVHAWELALKREQELQLSSTLILVSPLNYITWKADSSSKSEAKYGGNWRHSCASFSVPLRARPKHFFIFLYFSSKNLVKTDEIWMKSWILVLCLGSVLNFIYLKDAIFEWKESKIARDCCFCKWQRVTKQNTNVTQTFKISLLPLLTRVSHT
jgi:hypothetical protein